MKNELNGAGYTTNTKLVYRANRETIQAFPELPTKSLATMLASFSIDLQFKKIDVWCERFEHESNASKREPGFRTHISAWFNVQLKSVPFDDLGTKTSRILNGLLEDSANRSVFESDTEGCPLK